MSKDRKVIDVRSKFEYMLGKCEGSVNIPLQQISNHVEEIKKMKNPILCCASGHRSEQAVRFLKSKGIKCENGGAWREVKEKMSR